MEVREAPFGPALEATLIDAVVAPKDGDPLAGVTVVVPTMLAAVAVRRAVAAGRPIANLTTMTLGRLAGAILAHAGERRSPMPATVERELVRQALEPWADRFGAPDGFVGAAAVDAVVGAVHALSTGEVALEQSGRRDPGRRDPGRRGALLAVRDELDRHARTRPAGGQVAADAARVVERSGAPPGAVVLFEVDPSTLRGGDAELVAALDRVTRVVVVLGTGDRAVIGQSVDVGVTVAPDPDIEVADAISFVLEQAEQGVPLSRLAIVASAADPWLALVQQRLRESGVAFNGRRPERLGSTAAARFLLGGLHLDRRLERDAVVAWWASGPIRWNGHTVASDRWARLARLAGVVRGARQWRERLDQLGWAFEHPRRRQGADDAAPAAEWPWPGAPHDLADVRAAVDAAEAMVRDRSPRAWSHHAAAAHSLLDRFFAGARPDEIDGLAGVRAALDELAGLDTVTAKAVSHSVFVSALASALDRSAGRVGTFGVGVFTGTLDEIAGISFAGVAVVGLTDERLPSASGEPTLLGELDPAGAPARRARREAREQRLVAALLATPTCRLSFARTDPFAGRECLPSPWLLDIVAAISGREVSGQQLVHLATGDAVPGVRVIESYSSFVTSTRTALDRIDYEFAQVAAAVSTVVDEHPYVVADGRRGRALEAVRARASAGFGQWDGNVGTDDAPDLELVQRSPSGLESYAACPRRYFYERVLDLAEVDDPIEERTVSPRERGLLVHAALEALVEAGSASPAGERWSATARAAAHEALDRACDELERGGRTGTGLPWRLERHMLHVELDRTVERDDRLRTSDRLLPVAAEVRFGFDRPPATIDLIDGRRMEFHGFIDRIDATDDGRRVLVTDYKTGRAPTVNEMREERRRGRRLQLPIYALAARDLQPAAEAVEARYWYVSSRGNWEERAVALDDETLDELTRAVSIVIDGIENGRFPARPGERDRDSYVNCRYCPFDRLCAADRDREWERVRSDPALRGYAVLAEGDLDAG